MGADFTALGLAIGHATNHAGGTGLTVVRGIADPFRAAAAITGRATGTRELDALSPHHLVDRVDAILLTGGSAYGLAAAAGAMRWMEERHRGFPVSGGVVPIVPAAVIFDLAPLGEFTARPDAAMAYAACEQARPAPVEEGSVGAGTGATVGKAAGARRAMKGGFGCAVDHEGDVMLGAMAVVNALGDVRDAQGRIIAGARADAASGAFLDGERALAQGNAARIRPERRVVAAENTTLCIVSSNVALSRVELAQLAQAASAALARRITPVGTSFDGDVIFATAPLEGVTAPPLQVETLAVRVLSDAIERAVRFARGRDGIPGMADRSTT